MHWNEEYWHRTTCWLHQCCPLVSHSEYMPDRTDTRTMCVYFFLLNVASVTKFSSLLINSNPHSTTVTYSLLTGNLNLLFRRQDGLHPADVGKHPSLVGQELIIRHLPCALQARVVQSFLVQQPTNWPHIQPQLLHAILSVPVFSQLTPRWAEISQNTKFLQLLKRHANWMPLLEPILD